MSYQLTPVPWAPGYFATREGRVFSTWTRGQFSAPTGELRELRPGTMSNGYLLVVLYVERVRCQIPVHSLIAQLFLPPRSAGQELRHLDGDQKNNKSTNLRWGTKKENGADRVRHGTACRQGRRGENHWRAKLSAHDVAVIRFKYAGGAVTQRELADEFGVDPSSISNVINRKNWVG